MERGSQGPGVSSAHYTGVWWYSPYDLWLETMFGIPDMKAHVVLAIILLGALSCSVPEPPVQRMVIGLDPPAVAGSMAPHLAAAGSDIAMTWIEPGEGDHLVRFSRLGDDIVWTAPATVARGTDFFVNWADFPSVQRASSGFLIAHWLKKSGAGTYAYDVHLAKSEDDGATWIPLGTVHDDRTQTEHGFVSQVAEGDGVRVFWLDGRNMESSHPPAAGGHGGSMSLRTALVGERIGAGEVLDEMTCECCQTDAAMTPSGAIVVYRDRTEGEIRDISFIRRDGDGWTRPAPVHSDGWVVPGCPVNGPAVAAGGPEGRHVAVAWFTASENRPRVQAAFSVDAGVRFEAPVVIDAEGPVGRVDVEMDDAGDAIVSWLGGVDASNAAVRLIHVPRPNAGPPANPGGPAGSTPLTIALTGGSRASGYPRMARSGGDLIVAWTDTSGTSAVRTAAIPLSGIPRFSPAEVRVEGGAPGAAVPEYAANDLDGGSIALADMRGQPVLLNFWATWCLPCREEMPILEEIHERYAARGLRVVGVSLDDAASVPAVRAFVGEHRIPYMNLHDPEGRAYLTFGLSVLPGSLLIDDRGHIIWRRHGVIHRDDPEMERALEALFAEHAERR